MGDKLHCYHFAYRCPQSWDSLTPTALEGVRYCGHCSENVYWCNTGEQVTEHAKLGHCVAVQTRDGPGMGDPGHGESYRQGSWYAPRRPRAVD